MAHPSKEEEVHALQSNEKMDIIRLAEQSDLDVIRTLRQIKVNKTTFYKWYNGYQQHGYDGLARRSGNRKEV